MFKIIELDKIVSGKNIRNERDEEINELAKSIEENGLINPLYVKKIGGGKYEIIAGHRRFEAVKRLRLPYVECNIADDEKDEKDVMLAQIAENIQRKSMSALELVECFEEMKKRFGVKQYQIAHYFNKDETWVSNQYQAVKLLQSEYGEKVPAEMRNKTAGQIKAAAQRKTRGEAKMIFCKGMIVKVKGHTYTITCQENTAENELVKFIQARKI